MKKAIAGAGRQLAERRAILYAANAFALFNSLEDCPLSIYRNNMVIEVGRSGTKFHLDKNNTKEELKMLVDEGIIKPQAEYALPAYMTAPLKFADDTTDTNEITPITEHMLLSLSRSLQPQQYEIDILY